MSTIISILIFGGLLYWIITSQESMTDAYKQATGHDLNVKDTISNDIITGSIPGTKSVYAKFAHRDGFKQLGFHSLLSFEDNNMALVFYGKGMKPCAFNIPYSDIQHYYYKIDESGTNDHSYQSIDLYMTLTKGSIEISNIRLNKTRGLHYLNILRNKTVQGQQVKPTYNSVWYKHPIMHGKFINHVMKTPQSSLDEQQRNDVQHRIAEDEANTARESQFKSSSYITKILEQRYSHNRDK